MNLDLKNERRMRKTSEFLLYIKGAQFDHSRAPRKRGQVARMALEISRNAFISDSQP